MADEKKFIAGLGGVAIVADVVGMVVLIYGIARHFQYSRFSSECGSTVGSIGQAMSPQLQAQCNHASTWSEFGLLLAIGGAMILVWGLKMSTNFVVIAMIAAERAKASHTAPISARAITPTSEARERAEATNWNQVIQDVKRIHHQVEPENVQRLDL